MMGKKKKKKNPQAEWMNIYSGIDLFNVLRSKVPPLNCTPVKSLESPPPCMLWAALCQLGLCN